MNGTPQQYWRFCFIRVRQGSIPMFTGFFNDWIICFRYMLFHVYLCFLLFIIPSYVYFIFNQTYLQFPSPIFSVGWLVVSVLLFLFQSSKYKLLYVSITDHTWFQYHRTVPQNHRQLCILYKEYRSYLVGTYSHERLFIYVKSLSENLS